MPDKINPCECGGEAKVHGTPGYLVVRCLKCSKGGVHSINTTKGRKKTIREWNKANPTERGG